MCIINWVVVLFSASYIARSSVYFDWFVPRNTQLIIHVTLSANCVTQVTNCENLQGIASLCFKLFSKVWSKQDFRAIFKINTNNKRIKQEKSGLFYEKSISMHRHLTASSIQFTG